MQMEIDEPWELRFRWGGVFEALVVVPPNELAGLRPVDMTLVTLQKDNDPLWIRDWCLYYHRAHGVERIALYDNGSSDRQAVEQSLSGLDAGLDAVLIEWNFPYGDHRNNYCQIGALNHCLHVFGGRSSYYLNFDVDEYLTNRTPLPLAEYLKKHLSRNIASLSLDSVVIPNIPAHRNASVKRVRDFNFRLQRSRQQRLGGKNIFRLEGTRMVFIHNVSTDMGTWLRWLGKRLSMRLQGAYRRYGIWLPFLRALPGCAWEKDVSRKDLVYRHYSGLFTGYKEASWREPQEFDPRLHQPDTEMQGILKKHGIG